MKTAALFTACIVSAASAFAGEVIPHANEVKFLSVRLVATNGGINPSYKVFNVVATAEFSNDCMVPKGMAKEVSYGPGDHREYRVLAIDDARACPMVHMPVTREFVIDRIFTQDDMPSVLVNQIKAE